MSTIPGLVNFALCCKIALLTDVAACFADWSSCFLFNITNHINSCNCMYCIQENIRRGKLSCLQWKIAIHSKTFAVAFCRLILLIDMAIIHRKTFVVE